MEQNIKTLFIQMEETYSRLKHINNKLKNPQLPLALKESLFKQRLIASSKLHDLKTKIQNECEGFITTATYRLGNTLITKTFIGDEEQVRAYLKTLNQIFKQDLIILEIKSVDTRKLITYGR